MRLTSFISIAVPTSLPASAPVALAATPSVTATPTIVPLVDAATWDRTLGVLERAKVYASEIPYAVHTKSSLMVGLGESVTLRIVAGALLIIVAVAIVLGTPGIGNVTTGFPASIRRCCRG